MTVNIGAPVPNLPIIPLTKQINSGTQINSTPETNQTDKPVQSNKSDKSKETKEKYEKFVKEISKFSVNMNDFDFDHMLKNVFDIGGKLGLKPEDILGQKEIVKKFLPKVGELLEKADNEYQGLQKRSKEDGDTQVSFKDGVISFKTGQQETQLDSQGNIVPVQNAPKNKTQTELDLKNMSAGIKTENTEGDKFSAKVDVNDQTFGFSNTDKSGAGQSTTIDIKNQGFSTDFSVDGKNTIGISSRENGPTEFRIKQKGAGGITISGGAPNEVTNVALESEKLGGIQLTTRGNAKETGQTVVRANVKTNEGQFGATVRTGRENHQVELNAGKYGNASFGINSSGAKIGFNVNGTGGAFNISRSNDGVAQKTDKEGRITTTITDDNKWDGKVTYKNDKFGTVGLNMSKHKADSRSFVTTKPDPNNDITCKQEELTKLEEKKKEIINTPKSKRTEEQSKELEKLDVEIQTLETEIKDYGKSIEAKTDELMFVPDQDDNSGKPAGHEIAKQISKGDVYNVNQERTLTFGSEVGITGGAGKIDHKISKKVDIDLSVEGLGDNKVKLNVSRKVEIDNKVNANVASGIGTYEAEFENDKSSSYEVVIDLNTEEGKTLYDQIMSSSSNFKDKLPVPQESSGVHIVKSETEDVKTKDATKDLKVPSVAKFSLTKEHEINKTISQDGYEMTGDFTKTGIQDGDKVPLLGNIYSDEKIVTNGNYTITPPKQDQIKALESKKIEIQNNTMIPQSQKDLEIEAIDDKIELLNEGIETNNKSISELESKKTQLTEKQNLPQSQKDSRINDINKEIEDKKTKLKTDLPTIEEKKKEILASKKQINDDKSLSQPDKDLKLAELDKQIKSLDKEVTDLNESISNLEQEKIELRYTPEETKSEIDKLDVKIKELNSDSKTSFKITIDDSKVHTGEARRYNRLVNNLTDQDNQSDVKTRKYNDKSSISINVELFADQEDIEQIVNSSKQDFLKAAHDTRGINKNGDGVRKLERQIDRAEEKANKDADEKGLKNPSSEREALIQSARMDVIMKFVERNGKDGVAFLQTLTGGSIEVKTSEVTIEGLKANNIISDDKVKGVEQKSNEIGSDNQVTRKESKDVRHMKKEALDKKKELEDKRIKIDNNPMLNPAQKAELKANIDIKLEKITSMIEKLEELEKMRTQTLANK